MSHLQMMEPKRSDSLMTDEQSEKIQLSACCRNLADLDTFTVTDSFLVVRLSQDGKAPRQIIHTRVYDNDLNPNYVETAEIEYFFQLRQNLQFLVYHDNKPPILVGKANSTIGQIFGSRDNQTILTLLNSSNRQSGKIIVKCDKITKQQNKRIQMTIRGDSLPTSTGFFCCCSINPFFRIFRKQGNTEWIVYESQVILKNNNPTFKAVEMAQRKLTKNDPNQYFQIRFYDHSFFGNHNVIGSAFIKPNQIEHRRNFPIDQNGRNRGLCLLENVHRSTRYQFGDYIQAGLQLALVTCIDFTGSNGIPTSPESLHYMNGPRPSQYAQALSEVSKILLDYDYDKLVPVYGFGAKVRMPNFNTGGKVHHCFPINGSQKDPNVLEVEGILKAYRDCLRYLQFAGPTLFSGLLREAIEQCKEFKKQSSQYMILFILTDGQINDTQEVIDLIISCCYLPLSIIIVGIGNGDFGIMNQLDDDDKQMKDSHGNGNIRDLVQFVQFSKFSGDSIALARQVLEELPRQVAEYFTLMKMEPKDIKSQKNDIYFQMSSNK